MVYEKKVFLEAEANLMNYSKSSVIGNSIIREWEKQCKTLYADPNIGQGGYLKYSDARKRLTGMLQNSFIYFETSELGQVCDMILQILKFSDCSDKYLWTKRQKDAWFINKMIKKYDFSYWEVFLRDSGEDETDVVRKIYDYLQRWENRINVADTLSEYLYKKQIDTYEAGRIKSCIRNLESEEE